MQTVHLDLSQKKKYGSSAGTIFAKQGDVGRKFTAVITDNGEAYPIPEGTAISVWYSGTSGEGNYSAIGSHSAFSVSGNVITVEMIAQMLTNKGGGVLCLILNDSEGNQVGTWDVTYIVEEIPGIGSVESQQYFTALTEYADAVLASAKRVEEAAKKVNTQTILSKVYPIGSIYIATAYIPPANLFGGVWEQIMDKFLVGCGAFFEAESTGGEREHQLTLNEMPIHSHGITNGTKFLVTNTAAAVEQTVVADGTHNISGYQTFTTEGGGAAHNNLPPYLAVFIWKRVG